MSDKSDEAVKAASIRIGPKEAAEILDRYRWDRQRPVRRTNVESLAQAMINGEVGPSSPLTFAQLPTGERYLVDGQHRLEAVKLSGVPCTFVQIVQTVPDEESLARLYSSIDIGSSRTFRDTLVAYDAAHHYQLPINYLGTAVSAMGVLLGGFRPLTDRGTLKSRIVKEEMLECFAVDVFGLHEALTAGPYKGERVIRKSRVIAVGIVTFHYQAEKAAQFWRNVSLGENLSADDPVYTLRAYLFEGKWRTKSGNPEAHAVAVAWNAYFEGRPLQLLRAFPLAPIRIAGTPFDGKEFRRFTKEGKVVTDS